MFKNIILTGFMGTGKTSVGKRLASNLGYSFVDIDELIVEDQKMAITDIFAKKGEPYFRDVEAGIIKRVLQNGNQVISTGGGAVIREENRQEFKRGGLTVCLTARPELIFERIKHETHRPLLQVKDPMAKIKELLESRAGFYHQADFVIDTSGHTVEEVICILREKVRHECC